MVVSTVNGGFQMVVRVLSGELISLPPFYLNLTPFIGISKFKKVKAKAK